GIDIFRSGSERSPEPVVGARSRTSRTATTPGRGVAKASAKGAPLLVRGALHQAHQIAVAPAVAAGLLGRRRRGSRGGRGATGGRGTATRRGLRCGRRVVRGGRDLLGLRGHR